MEGGSASGSKTGVKRKLVDESDITAGEVDIKFSSRRVWLVKVPNFLAESWTQAPSNTPLGNVYINEDKSTGKPPVMSISLSGQYAQELPKKYDLLYTPATLPIHIFSESQTSQLALEGTVEYRCDVQPEDSEEYRKLCRERNQKYLTKTRVVQRFNDEGQISRRYVSRDVKKREEKKERMGKEDLISLVFSMFEEASYYDIKALVDKTQQPMTWLKEVLSELCIYNKRGPHKGLFELKPHLKKKGK